MEREKKNAVRGISPWVRSSILASSPTSVQSLSLCKGQRRDGGGVYRVAKVQLNLGVNPLPSPFFKT